MKILIYDNNDQERAFLQNAIEQAKHECVSVGSEEDAWKLITTGKIQLLISTLETIGSETRVLLQRICGGSLAYRPYILTLVSAGQSQDNDAKNCCDDTLIRPLATPELISRITIAGRMIDLESKLIDARTLLEKQSMVDSLTKFMNRTAYKNFVRGELERAKRQSSPLSLILIHVGYQAENEHDTASRDNILRAVAQIIHAKKRPYDGVGRWSDDEFMIALPGVSGFNAENIAKRMLDGIASAYIEKGRNYPSIKASVGIFTLRQTDRYDETLDEIIQRIETISVQAQQDDRRPLVLVEE
jgi:diguanylate cyclase (GGDEF)-like protein